MGQVPCNTIETNIGPLQRVQAVAGSVFMELTDASPPGVLHRLDCCKRAVKPERTTPRQIIDDRIPVKPTLGKPLTGGS